MSEGVIKSGHREPFTVLYKSAIRDTRLSFEMLGQASRLGVHHFRHGEGARRRQGHGAPPCGAA